MDLISQIKNYYNKVILFYKPDAANYWNSLTICNITEKPESIGKYYLDFSSKFYFPGKFDNSGIPLYSYKRSDYFYHPIVICQYALGVYEMLSRSNFYDEKLKEKFLLQADWLINNYVELDNSISWNINYEIDEYGIKSPFISAMAQGEAISVLIRAYQITENKKYLNVSVKTLGLFNKKVKDGGIINYFKDIPVYEEYPSPKKTVGVLNGFIFSLFGLYDLYLSGKNQNAKKLFDKGINSLTQLIDYYDIGYWTQYYLFDYPKKYPATYTYHILVTEQLKSLRILTGITAFDVYIDRWENYGDNFYYKTKVLINKLLFTRKITS